MPPPESNSVRIRLVFLFLFVEHPFSFWLIYSHIFLHTGHHLWIWRNSSLPVACRFYCFKNCNRRGVHCAVRWRGWKNQKRLTGLKWKVLKVPWYLPSTVLIFCWFRSFGCKLDRCTFKSWSTFLNTDVHSQLSVFEAAKSREFLEIYKDSLEGMDFG